MSAVPTLVVDVGGTRVKMLASGETDRRRFESGATLTPERFVEDVRRHAEGWTYQRLSIGFPAPVRNNRVVKEPANLGPGWVGFDFEAAFGLPTRVVNDALMQAVGSYEGGRMLFLGLGTGLGAALILDNVVQPLEFGVLPFRRGQTFEDEVGTKARHRLGQRRWRAAVHEVVRRLRHATQVDYVVVGGGNVTRLDRLPDGARPGRNANAFKGGFRLWEENGLRLP